MQQVTSNYPVTLNKSLLLKVDLYIGAVGIFRTGEGRGVQAHQRAFVNSISLTPVGVTSQNEAERSPSARSATSLLPDTPPRMRVPRRVLERSSLSLWLLPIVCFARSCCRAS